MRAPTSTFASSSRRGAKRGAKRVAKVAAVGLGLAAWLSACGGTPPSVEAWDATTGESAPPRYRYLHLAAAEPDAERQEASLLERRLAAFAQEVERRKRKGRVPPPLYLDQSKLEAELEKIIVEIEEDADVAVHVRDLIGGHVVYDHWGDAMLNPASNHKIVTSAAAIDLLGPDYTFETWFAVREGTLYVRGEGDPTLDEEALGVAIRRVRSETEEAAIERIVIDDTAFSPERLAPGFDAGGEGASYQAPSGALSLNFNTVEVLAYAVKGARRPGVVASPSSTHLEIDNQARVGSKTRLTIRTSLDGEGDEARTRVEVRGTMATGGRAVVERRRIGDPGLYTGGALAALLAAETGGAPPSVSRGRFPSELEPDLVWTSVPLQEVADRVLAFSNNFIAEQLLRTMGWRLSGEPGDWANGRAALEGYWTAIGNDPASLVFENGSGLSRGGRISPSSLVDLIALAQRRHRDAGLVAALPVAGQEGTLQARLRGSGKRVRAKTGTMDGVSGLSGVILGEDGSAQIAFSILVNAHRDANIPAAKRRRVEDAIVMTLLQHLDDWELRWAIEVLDGTTVTPSSETP